VESRRTEVQGNVATRSGKRCGDDSQQKERHGNSNTQKKKSRPRDPVESDQEVSPDGEAAAEDGLVVPEGALAKAQDERSRRIVSAQQRGEWCDRVVANLRGCAGIFPSATAWKKTTKIADVYVLDSSDVLYYCLWERDYAEGRTRLVVPSVLQEGILRAYITEVGGGAHRGVGRVFARMRELYYWCCPYADVGLHVASRDEYVHEEGKPQRNVSGNVAAAQPFQVLALTSAMTLPRLFQGYESAAGASLSATNERLCSQEVIRYDQELAMGHAEIVQKKLNEDRVQKRNTKVEEELGSTMRRVYRSGRLIRPDHDIVKTRLMRKLPHFGHDPHQLEGRVAEVVYRVAIDTKENRLFPLVHISRIKPIMSRTPRPREKVQVDDEFTSDEALLPEDSWYELGEGDEQEVEELIDVKHQRRKRRSINRKRIWSNGLSTTIPRGSQRTISTVRRSYMSLTRRGLGRAAVMQRKQRRTRTKKNCRLKRRTIKGSSWPH
jgi:hypothetical protein